MRVARNDHGNSPPARVPPRAARREEQIVDAVPVEIAHAVLPVRIELDRVVWPERDLPAEVIAVFDRDRVIAPVVLEALVRKDVVVDVDVVEGSAADVDRVALHILECVVRVGVAHARLAALAAAAGAVDVELVRVDGEKTSVVNSAALQGQVAERFVASRVALRRDRVAVEVEQVLRDQAPRAVIDLDAVAGGMAVPRGPGMLIVVDEVPEDPDLLRTPDALPLDVRRRFLTRTIFRLRIVHDMDSDAAPSSDLHVGDLDIQAAENMDADVVVLLIAKRGPEEAEAGDTHVVVRLQASAAADVEKDVVDRRRGAGRT